MMHWGTGAGNSINQSYHIPHRRNPEPLVLAERNAGPGYEIADLTMSKRPGTSYRIKIHFAVFNYLYLLFSFMKLVKTVVVIMFSKESYKSTRNLELK